MVDKLRELDARFNTMARKLLRGMLDIVDGESHALDLECQEILDPVEARLCRDVDADPSSPVYSKMFYEATKEKHEMLIKRDPALFADEYLLRVLGETSGAKETGTCLSQYLFRRLDTEGKARLWKWLVEMYRIAVVVHIYMENPSIKEIINILLKDGVDQKKMMENLLTGAKGKKKLGRLMRKLTQSTDETFQGILDSLRRVLETFCATDDSSATNPELTSIYNSLSSAGVGDEDMMRNSIDQLRKSGLVQADLVEQLEGILAGDGACDMESVLGTLSALEV